MMLKPSLLRFEMPKIYKILFFLPLLLLSEELEVRLTTQSQLKPLYLSRIYTDPSDYDWRYFEEIRSILEFDLNINGYCAAQPPREELEKKLEFPDPRKNFDLTFWKSQRIPYLVALYVVQNQLTVTVFDLEKEYAKKIETKLTGYLEEDRKTIHRLSDSVTKHLFGVDGIASLRILYSQRIKSEEDWESEIWVCDVDGNRPQLVIRDKGYALSPGFFPKSDETTDPEFYYVSYKEGQSKIFRSFLSQKEGTPMLSLRGNQALPAVSPKGGLLAFITDVAGRPDLFLQTLDKQRRLVGKARQIYSQPKATQASPTFSPDGKHIAFVSDKDGPPRVYRIEVPSPKTTHRLKPQLLTTKNRENTSPSWSPDGKKLAYSAKTEGVRQIWIYDFDTQEEKQLTFGPQNKENPSWAPNSFHLVYNTETDDVCELYLIHLNQPDPIRISKGMGQKRFPCWEPR